ncbi:MAG: AI-2E family transporter [Thermodesulfobacteriota bacterium]
MNIVREWVQKQLSNPQVVILVIIIAAILFILMTMGHILTPVIASLVLAYLLEGFIRPLQRFGVPRLPAVCIVFILFLLALFFLVLGLLPMLTKQVGQFIQELPRMINTWQQELQHLPERYPQLISESQINRILQTIGAQLSRLGENLLSISLASVRGLINILVYMVLVPIMIFFLLKDKTRVLIFLQGFLPNNVDLASQVWQEVNHKIARFIQGKIWEILIVWAGSYLTFLWLDLEFNILLSFLVGISVIVPYVGATVMTIPVALVAYFQWGWDPQFMYAMIAYFIIQLLDGNVLVPLLLSGIVNLHPLAVIIGILVFGGIWGFWGVFFAIPLATLVHAIIKAWPRQTQTDKEQGENTE